MGLGLGICEGRNTSPLPRSLEDQNKLSPTSSQFSVRKKKKAFSEVSDHNLTNFSDQIPPELTYLFFSGSDLLSSEESVRDVKALGARLFALVNCVYITV